MTQELPTLYDHQILQKDTARAALAKHRAVVICANPGVGKTRMAKWILGTSLNRAKTDKQSGNVVFAVHRRGLVDNASDSFNEHPVLNHGTIMSGRDTNWNHPVQVGSIDTMLSWYVDGEYQSDHTFDMVVFDECHSHLSKLRKWLEPHDAKRAELGLNPTFVIGLSATPECKGLADVFGQIITGPTTEWLIEQKFLSPYRYFMATQGRLDALVKRGNEFTKDSVCTAMQGLSGDLVRDWRMYGDGRPTVGFFPRLSQAREAQELLLQDGVVAEYVDGETPDAERRSLFAHLQAGRIEYLTNVGVIERGLNLPVVSCVQLCTAIGNIVRYRQMIGRGSRVSPGKTDCIVIDHGGNIKRHGFFEDEVDWILDDTKDSVKEHEAVPSIECPQCHRMYRGGKCDACGYEPTTRERKAQGLEFDGSTIVEVKRKPKAEKTVKTCEQIMVMSLYKAGRSERTWKQALGIAYGIARSQGTRFKVPKKFTVGGRTYHPLPYGSPDGNRRVKHLYDFV